MVVFSYVFVRNYSFFHEWEVTYIYVFICKLSESNSEQSVKNFLIYLVPVAVTEETPKVC
jgi:hypothetical protein